MRWGVNNISYFGVSAADGIWQHYAATYNGTWTFYTNGAVSGTYAGGLGTWQSNALSVYLGNGYNGYYSGTIDEAGSGIGHSPRRR